MRQRILTLLAGMVLGAALFGTTAAAANYLTATPSAQPIYVDGQRVDLNAYSIADNNYVMLRDVGRVVGFNVYWDAANGTVQIETDRPYTGLPPAKDDPTVPDNLDYSAQASPDIFAGGLTREVYNAIRDAVVHREEILSGNYVPISVAEAEGRYDVMCTAASKLGNYPVYTVTVPQAGRLSVTVKYTHAYDTAAAHTQPFLDSLTGLSDSEKVRELAWYVCDRMTYSTAITSPTKILASDGVTAGNCMAYAHSFLFLCQRAGVPCVLVCSETHQWNMVYVDGQWWDVDVGAADASDSWMREYVRLFTQPSERMGAEFTDRDPAMTRFAQELLVPGSSK